MWLRILCSSFVIMVTFSRVYAAPVAYVGIVGTGEGLGRFGHAFAVVYDTDYPDFTAAIYHYFLRKRDGSTVETRDLLFDPEALEFKVEKLTFAEFYGFYNVHMDRLSSFIQLNFSESEVRELFNRLEADLANPGFGREHRYSPWGMNCITRIIHHINAIVGPDRRIETITDVTTLRGDFWGLRSRLSNGILNQLPFNVARHLEAHPVSTGRVRVFERIRDTHARSYLAILRRVREIQAACRLSDPLAEALLARVFLSLQNPSRHPLEGPLRTLVQTCPGVSETVSVIALLAGRVLTADDQLNEREKLLSFGLELRAGRSQ